MTSRCVVCGAEGLVDVDVLSPALIAEWGLAPDEVEFWQGRPNRLHDRIHYTLHPESGWQRVRHSP